MSIAWHCQNCHQNMSAAEKHIGRRFRCPKCGIIDRVPKQSAVPMTRPVPAEQPAPLEHWYVDQGTGHRFGPATKQQLDRWMIQGCITSTSRIWCSADQCWRPAAEVYPALHAQAYRTAEPQTAFVAKPVLPHVREEAETKESITVDPTTFWFLLSVWFACYAATFVACGLFLKTVIAREHTAASTAFLAYLAFTVAGFIAFVILIYKGWQLIQDGRVQTTPAAAAAYLFVPFYNLGWVYTAFAGLASDMNGYIARHKYQVRRASSLLPWWSCTLTLCSLIPFVGTLFALANIIVFPLAMLSITTTATGIAKCKRRATVESRYVHAQDTNLVGPRYQGCPTA
jgi:hypothetical protein